jgi:hypothetical protein
MLSTSEQQFKTSSLEDFKIAASRVQNRGMPRENRLTDTSKLRREDTSSLYSPRNSSTEISSIGSTWLKYLRLTTWKWMRMKYKNSDSKGGGGI